MAQPLPPDDLGAEELAKANAAGVDAIGSVSVYVVQHMEAPGIISGKSKNSEFTWYWSREEERVQVRSPGAPQNNLMAGKAGLRPAPNEEIIDRYNGTKGFKETFNVDPNDPPKLSETDGGYSSGSYGSRSLEKNVFVIPPKAVLLWEVQENLDTHTLSHLVRSAKNVRVAKRPSESALRCYELEIVREAVEYRVYVDPAANFMIRRVDTRYKEESPVTKVKPRGFMEVNSFRDFGDGAFLPTGLHGEMTEKATATLTVEVEVKSVNQPLAAETFEIKFVDWLRVRDIKTGQIHLWGADDKPRRTFESRDKYWEWYGPIFTEELAAQRRPLWVWGAVAATVIVMAAGGVCLIWRWRRRAGASVKS